MSVVTNFRQWSRREGCPITIAWLSSVVLATTVLFFTPNLNRSLILVPGKSPIWTFATYWLGGQSIVGFGVIWFIFMIMWMLRMGGSVERDLGTQKYGAFAAASILISALLWLGGAFAFNSTVPLESMLLPLGCTTVAWCSRHPAAPMCFWGMTVAAKWIGWLMVIIVFTSSGFLAPQMGLVACIPLAASFAFATNRIPGCPYATNVHQAKPSKAAKQKERVFLENVKDREKERAERERLRKLFEGSMKDD